MPNGPQSAPGGAVGKGASQPTASDAAGLWPIVLLTLQLGGLLALIIGLRIENPAFYGRIAPLAMGGAIINHLLPAKHRLAFFSLLSLAGIWLVFGALQGTWVISIGLVFILICHLPVAFRWRMVLLVLAAMGLATFRADLLPAPWSPAIWSIVGSMLMFRLIVYAYELSHAKGTFAWPERLAYFFCLPNVTFPLFPVIDFATFRRTYYDRPAMGIYQEGVAWILRGLVHLVGYRLVYQYGTLSPAEVRSGTDLVIYVMANFGLYLRVSGQFHLIIGILHLFGFRLPETHRFFYLASNFSDLWRRINIYWKDFMQKVFYMPLLFRLKKTHGETFSMVASTILVFVVTWFFHSYQWFWLLGTWLWSTTDTLFWAFLGACLITNSLYERRVGRTRSLETPRPTAARLIRHGAQTASMFALMALLWALWTSPTMGAFADLIGNARFGIRDVGVVMATWVLVATIAALAFRRTQAAGGVPSALPRWTNPATAAALAVIPLGAFEAVRATLPPAASAVLARARDVQLNKRDQEELQRGYYEKIVGVNRFNNELWRVYSLRPTDWVRLDSTGAVRPTEDDRLEELVPGWSEMFHGGRLTINSQGFRDREYDLAKPEGVFRIVLLGQSYVLGEGVNDDETFENVLEERLTADDAKSLGYTRVEILNFGAPAYSAMQQRADLAVGRVGRWQPDAVIVVGHFREFAQIDDYFMSYMRQRSADRIPASVSQWIDSAGIQPTMTSQEATRRMAPFASQILRETYQDMVRRIGELGATPVFAYIPTPATRADADVLARYLETTKDAGFSAWLDLRDAYQGLDEATLTITAWDHHPNAAGHRRLAERLHAELRSRPELWRRRNARQAASPDRGDESATSLSSAPAEPAATRRP